MFAQKTIDAVKQKGEKIPKLANLAESWKSLKNSDKKNYIEYAEYSNKEKEFLQNFYELVININQKKPTGAFRVFLQQKAKEKDLYSHKEGKDIWDKLLEDKKFTI